MSESRQVTATLSGTHLTTLQAIADEGFGGDLHKALTAILRDYFDHGLHLTGVGLSDKSTYRVP